MGLLLNPVFLRWMAIGAILVSAMAFGWVKRGVHDEKRYDALQASYEAFKAKVAGEGIAAQQKAVAVQQKQKEVSDASIKGLESDLSDVRTQYARVRSESGARGRALSSLASSSLGACPAQAAKLSDQLAAVEGEVLDLLQRADEEHARYVKLWDWTNSQAQIKP